MAKRRLKKKSIDKTRNSRRLHRRVHYAVDKLPDELRMVVKGMIIGNIWPDDLKEHYSGIPRFEDVVKYCKTRGYPISKSAIGRFLQQLKTVSVPQIASDFRNYARAHLGTLCLVYANIQSDLEISTIDSDKRKVLEMQQEKNITRIEKLIADLRKLDSSYPNSMQGG
jgi:hypothetical protein